MCVIVTCCLALWCGPKQWGPTTSVALRKDGRSLSLKLHAKHFVGGRAHEHALLNRVPANSTHLESKSASGMGGQLVPVAIDDQGVSGGSEHQRHGWATNASFRVCVDGTNSPCLVLGVCHAWDYA